MIVNDLVSTISITRNRLDHFNFSIWDPKEDIWILIEHATLDDYILLCTREVDEWMFSEDNPEKIDIFLSAIPSDHFNFRDAKHM